MPYDDRDSRDQYGPIFTAPFSNIAVAEVRDLFCITSPTVGRVALREIRLGQYSEFGDAQAELISLQIMTGSTTISSGGATITPLNVRSSTLAPTARSSVVGPSTTPASSASAVVRVADSFNVAAGWLYTPRPYERIILDNGQRAVLRFGSSAPVDSITLNGTLTFQELPRLG